jgi:NADH-quinone oxidoreductase subunit L
MFHLTTHAFFKALLFLGAGSVIHGLHHEQNLFNMGPKTGSLIKLLPVTYGLMWLGSLALAGIPPFAGFFSKDGILESAFMAPNGAGLPLYIIGTLGAFLTAIYSFRVLFMAFHAGGSTHAHDAHHHALAKSKTHKAEAHGHHDHHHTPHESPWIMLLPMLPLAGGAVFAGYFLQHMLYLEWWHGAIAINEAHSALEASHHTPFVPKYLPLLLAASGIGISYYLFAKHRELAKQAARTFTLAYAISLNKWYIDEIYHFIIVRPTSAIARFFSVYGDKFTIDGTINGTAAGVARAGGWLRRGQTGYVYHYAFAMLVALTAGLGYLLWRSL